MREMDLPDTLLPPVQSASKLEPYRVAILRWRRAKPPVSYRRIQSALAASGVHVALRTLYQFVDRRTRARIATELQCQPVVDTLARPQVEHKPMGHEEDTLAPHHAPVPRTPRLTPEERDAMRATASAAKHTPHYADDPHAKPLFEYDPDRPLNNQHGGN
jgi:hypothetical protein